MPQYSSPVPPQRVLGEGGRVDDYNALRDVLLELRNSGLLDRAEVDARVNNAINALPAVATTGLYTDLIGAPTVGQGGGSAQLPAPTGVAFYATTERRVGVSASNYPNATGYRIYRDGQSGPLGDTTSNVWVSGTAFTNGTYTFYICAIVDGKETLRAQAGPLTVDGQARYSVLGTATGPIAPPPVTETLPAPTGMIVSTNTAREITVTCDPYPGASEYRLYEDGTQGILATLTAPNRTSTPQTLGSTYHYQMSAVVNGKETQRADVGDILVDGTIRSTANGTGSNVGAFDSNFDQVGPLSSAKFKVSPTAGSSAAALGGYAQLKTGTLGAYADHIEIESKIAPGANRYITFDTTPQSTGESYFGIVLRATNTTGTLDASPRFNFEINADGFCSLYKIAQNGQRSMLANGKAIAGFAAGTTVHIDTRVVGDTVRGWFWTGNNKPTTPTLVATDFGLTGTGRCGIAMNGGSTAAARQWDIGLFRVGTAT